MAVVLLLLVTPIIGFCNCSIFVTFCPFLFCHHHNGEKRELDALLCLSSWCFMLVVWLFLSVPCSRTIFGCYSCEQRWLWQVCTFAWSSLSLRPSSKFLCGGSNGDWMPICASREGSGESASHCIKCLVLPKMAICVLFTPAANTLVSLHICAGKVTRQCDKYQISCAGSEGSWESAHLHRLAWAFVTVSKYHMLAEMAISKRLCEQRMLWWVCTSNHITSVQPSVRCINASKNAPSAL